VTGSRRTGTRLADGAVVLMSEFAAVRVSVDTAANGPRLLVEDLESGEGVFLDPLELASFCHAGEGDRLAWLLVGPYRDHQDDPDDRDGRP
jgi:hypothetical protein